MTYSPARKSHDVVVKNGIPMRVQDAENPPDTNIRAHFDFEDNTFGGLSTKRLVHDYSAVIQSDIVRTGTRAVRFELRPDDYISEGHRAELRDWLNAPLEHETWYGFSTYLPHDFPVSENVGCVLAQWHDQAKLGEPAGKPPLAIRFKKGCLTVTGAQSVIASHAPDHRFEFLKLHNFALATWTDFVFRIYWSRHGNSQITAWVNGHQVMDYTGKLGYENETTGPYFKFGMYGHGDFSTPHIVYHDNYSRGLCFDHVNPVSKDKPCP